METYDYLYRNKTRIFRVTKTENGYECFWLDNDGTEAVNWGETFPTFAMVLKQIHQLERTYK